MMLLSQSPWATSFAPTKMPQSSRTSLWSALSGFENLSDAVLWGANASVGLIDLLRGSALGNRAEELRGRSVIIATKDQLTAALALIELDGVARRLVLCPADLPLEHVSFVIDAAGADTLVSDRALPGQNTLHVGCFVPCTPNIAPASYDRKRNDQPTEW